MGSFAGVLGFGCTTPEQLMTPKPREVIRMSKVPYCPTLTVSLALGEGAGIPLETLYTRAAILKMVVAA